MSTTIEPALLRSRPLAEVVEIVSGFGFPKELQGKSSGDLPFFKVGDISAAWNSGQKKLIQAQHYLDRSEASVIKAKAFPSGTVVFAKIGEAIKLNRRAILGQPSIVDNNVMGLVPKEGVVDPNYLFYWTLMLRLGDISQATTVPSVRKSDVEQLAFPWLPIDQQKRIVAEIEKQFSRLDEAVANLKRVKANLKRYKAAVLKAAVEGRLVETEAEIARREGRSYETGEQLLQRILKTRRSQWQGKGKYKEPAAPDTTALPELPEGWVWATVEQLNLSNRPCAYGVLQPGDDMADGIPFVRVGDIDDGRIDLTTLKRISPKIAAQYPRTKLIGGEFLITLVGAIGRTALVPETLAGANVARAVGVVPLADALNARWVEFWFRNPAKVIEMTSKSHEVARKTLNLEDVRAASVAVPPLAEQHLIVAEVDRRLSILRETEAQVDANLQHAERLRQSILERAYSGDRDRIYAVNMEPSELPL
jgi:type I restriction enzyme S subunit